MYKASEPELNFPTFWCLVAQAWLSACVKAERHENLLTSYLLYESQPYPACKCVHVSLVCVIHLTTSAFLWWGALVSGQSEGHDIHVSLSTVSVCRGSAKFIDPDCQKVSCVLWMQGLCFQMSAPIHCCSADPPQELHSLLSGEKLSLTHL